MVETQVRDLGIRIWPSSRVLEAHASRTGVLEGVSFASKDGARRVACDALLMSVGWAPAMQLLLQAAAQVKFDEQLQQYVPAQLPPGVFAAGRVNGVYEAAAKMADGRRAGEQAAQGAGYATAISSAVPRSSRAPSHAWPVTPHAAGKNFIDFDEDLQLHDLENAAREGFDSIELMKRYSTLGMGPSQGKHANMNAMRVLARVRGHSVAEIGFTTARPMYHPVALKMLAGRGFNPTRATPIDACHRQLNAVWMPAGQWMRPEYYALPGKSRAECIDAEVRCVHERAGIIDVGTLGKIEIHGRDAGLFLDRVYTGQFSTMVPGTTRYALMLDEAGTIIDDGVVARLSTERYYFTTTTGNSATVYRELQRLLASWRLQCSLVNVTGHRAAMNVVGPRSREILKQLTDLDLSEHAFPYLGVREAEVAGARACVMRVGFTGELGFEVHVPFSAGAELWNATLAAGGAYDVLPFGVMAQRALRLEKGHFIVGHDTDGLTNPIEARAMWAVKMHKPFFIGQRSLQILAKRGPRQSLVGFELEESPVMPLECHLVIRDGDIAGRVTSIAFSTMLQKTIGLAMVHPSLSELDTRLEIRVSATQTASARVVPTPFYDPRNERQRVEMAA